MKRLLVLAAAGVLIIALAALVAWRALSAAHREDVVEPPKQVVAPPEPAIAPPADANSTQPVANVEQREAVADSAPADAASSLEFTVVDGRSGEPVADAEVRWVNVETQEPVEVDQEDLLESMRDIFNPDLAVLEQRVNASGLVTRTTGDGIARVPDNANEILARKGDLLGGRASLYDDDKRLTMHLWPDGDLRVRAVDAAGKAIGGIGVLLVSKYAGSTFESVILRALTDADGLATLKHAFAVIASSTARSPSPPSEWRVALDTIPAVHSPQALDVAALPRDVITLQAPALGDVELLVRELDGRAADVGLPALLAEVDRENTPENGEQSWNPPIGPTRFVGCISAPVVEGRAVFHDIGLGLRLIALVERNKSSSSTVVRFDGPTAEKQAAQAKIVLGATTIVFTGRALDADGNPLRNTRLRSELFSLPSPERVEFINADPDETLTASSAPLVTRDDGGFTLEYATDAAFGGRPMLALTLLHRDAFTLAARVDPLGVWSIGTHSLGDVRLVPAPVLAAGVIVDDAGKPLADVEVGIDSSEGGMHYPREVASTKSNSRGEFELRSAHPQIRVSLSTAHKAFAPFNSSGVPGRTDWRIVLKGACKLVARVRLPLNSPRDAFGISVHRMDVENSDGRGDSYSTLNEDGSFEQEQLPPGTYALVVYPRSEYHTEVARVDGVVLRAGETTDAGAIDLAKTSRAVTVHVVTPDDVRFRVGRYAFGADGSTLINELWSDFPGKELRSDELHLAREGARLDVAIAAPDLRIKLFSDVHDGDVLRMERALPVTIALSNSVSAPPAGVQLGIGLIRADLERRALLLTQIDWYRAEFDARGEATVPAPGPGRYLVRWILAQNLSGSGASRYWQEPPQYVEIADTSSPQRFELACPIDPATDWDKK